MWFVFFFFPNVYFIDKRITHLIPNCWNSVGHFELSLRNNQAWKTWPIKFQRHQWVKALGSGKGGERWQRPGGSLNWLTAWCRYVMAGGQVQWCTAVCALRHTQCIYLISILHDFKRNILKTWKGILIVGLIVQLTDRDAKTCFFYLDGQLVCMCVSNTG